MLGAGAVQIVFRIVWDNLFLDWSLSLCWSLCLEGLGLCVVSLSSLLFCSESLHAQL